MKMNILVVAGICGALAVVIGAFGAHGLKDIIEDPSDIAIYNKGVQYQFYHTFALLAVGILSLKYPLNSIRKSALFFLLGIILFSGSLYLLSLRNTIEMGVFTKVLGPITPIGGILFVIGWIQLILGVRKININE